METVVTVYSAVKEADLSAVQQTNSHLSKHTGLYK